MNLKQLFSLLLSTPLSRVISFAWFRIKLSFIRSFNLFPEGNSEIVVYPPGLSHEKSEYDFIKGDSFTFLNRTVVFKEHVDWGHTAHGKLWAIHLESFEYLMQEGVEKEKCLNLVRDYILYRRLHPSSFEPYSASLRIINWIKFFSENEVTDAMYSRFLFSQAKKLYHSIEWHLRNNHLMENAFALLFAGQYFRNENFYNRGKRILEREIERQILPDGAHFELSPMYHMKMLFRILESKDMLRNNRPGDRHFEDKLTAAASLMLGWMKAMQFANGDMPMVNDSANGMAPSPESLTGYAGRLGIREQKVILKESGYRKFKASAYECLVDAGGLAPAVNAGHGHADSLHFILYAHNKPFIIDTGVSTYENNSTRFYERSTMAHNTVTAGGRSQSLLWGAFRLGKRVKLIGITQGENFIESSVRFYDNSMIHNRRFNFFENSIVIHDHVLGENLETAKSFLYVDKNSEIAKGKSILNSDIGTIEFNGDTDITVEGALAASEFNRQVSCNRITISFETGLITTFTFHKVFNSGK